MTATENSSQRPAFTSVSIYNHPSGLLSFWYASEWQLDAAPAALPAITLTPDPSDPETHMRSRCATWPRPWQLKERPAILEGVREGLAKLEAGMIESLTELREDGRWGVEWHCTFLAGGERCRRRGRIFFSDRYQYAIVLQGSSEERYAYWQGMFEWTMLTVGTAPFSIKGWQACKRLPKSRKRRCPSHCMSFRSHPFVRVQSFQGVKEEPRCPSQLRWTAERS